MYTYKDYYKYMVAGIGYNSEYLLRLTQSSTDGSRVITGQPYVSSPGTPKTTESPSIDVSAVNEIAKRHSAQVSTVGPRVGTAPVDQPEVTPVSKEVALNLFSKPKYSAAETYNKLVVASLYPPAKAAKVVDSSTAPKADSYKDLLSGAALVGVGFNGDNNINNKKIYFAA